MKLELSIKDKYYQLYYTYRIHEYSKIDAYSNLTPGEAKLKYNSIDEFYMKELNISKEKLLDLRSDFKQFNSLYSKYYNSAREDLFADSDKFMEWFIKQNDECNYCKLSQGDLLKIVEKRNGNLTLNKKTKRSKGTLEIEKLDPEKGYTYENSVLACPFCNNAKSNLISETDWRDFFVPSVQSFIEMLLSK